MNLIIKKSGLAIFIVAAGIGLVAFMITITIIPISLVPNVVFAQQNKTTATGPVTNFTKLVYEQFSSSGIITGVKIPALDVLYESPKSLVLRAEITILLH